MDAAAADDQLMVVAIAVLLEDRQPAADDMAVENPVQHNKQLWFLAVVEEETNLYDDIEALVGPVGEGDNLQKSHMPLPPHPQGQILGTIHLDLTQQERLYKLGRTLTNFGGLLRLGSRRLHLLVSAGTVTNTFLLF